MILLEVSLPSLVISILTYNKSIQFAGSFRETKRKSHIDFAVHDLLGNRPRIDVYVMAFTLKVSTVSGQVLRDAQSGQLFVY